MAQLGSASYATWEVQCRLCLKKLDDIGDYVEITQKINKTILEIFPPDLVRFQSDSMVICEQCLEISETCASFRSEIVRKHEKQEQQLLAVVKIECEPVHLKAVVIKTELEEKAAEYFTDLVSYADDDGTSMTNEPPSVATQNTANASLKPKQKPKPFECDLCGKKFAARFFLAEHILTHIPLQYQEKLFQCLICRKEFKSYGCLRQHGRVNHPGKVFQSIECPYCPRRLERHDLLQKHIERAHRVDRRTCHICQQVLSSQRGLEHHIKAIHLNEVVDDKRNELVTCEICGMTMKRLSIIEHRKLHYQDKWRFSCDLCGKKCRQKTHITEHVKTHTPVEFREKKHQCSVCKKRFRREDRLFHHLRMGHEGLEYGIAGSLECHCGKTFNARHLLRAHMKRVHNREKFQKSCEVCGKVVANLDSLNQHMKSLHSNGTKDFVCNVCGKKFVVLKYLNKHVKQAHGEMKFVCEFDGCGKNFTRTQTLKIHKKTIHLQQKEFKCTFEGCNKEYAEPRPLKNHIKLVHEKRRQNCPIDGCSSLFGRRGNLKSHLKNHKELTADEMSDAIEMVKQMDLVS